MLTGIVLSIAVDAPSSRKGLIAGDPIMSIPASIKFSALVRYDPERMGAT
jgi:hypothetical protein